MSDEEKDRKEVRINDMFEMPYIDDMVQSPVVKLLKKVSNVVEAPVVWVRVNIVERFRGPKYPYYHQKFRRVPTIDQCYTDDQSCIYEANEQYKRDKKVDENILNIVRNRFYKCCYYERGVNEFYNHETICPKERADYKEAELNFFIKYGDLSPYSNVIDAFMKQKYRLVWERRQASKLDSETSS